MVDHIFWRTCSRAKTALNFIEFIECLRYVATHLRTSLNDVMERIVLIANPS